MENTKCVVCNNDYQKRKKAQRYCSMHCAGMDKREQLIERNKSRRKYDHIPGKTKGQIFRLNNPQSEKNRAEKDNYKRVIVINYLGARCIRCGYDKDVRALQLDHINGHGYKDRLRVGCKIHRYYIKNLEESKLVLQVLCANCNKIKQIENNEFALSKRNRHGKIEEKFP